MTDPHDTAATGETPVEVPLSPAPLPVSAANLAGCGANLVLADAADAWYADLADRLATAARGADDPAHAAALRLLGGICTMHLDPDDQAEPYKAGFISFSENRRTPVPEDFERETLCALAAVVPEIAPALLRARVADLLWLHHRPRDIRFLQLAVDGYVAWIGTPALERWHGGQEACITRVLQLAVPSIVADRRDALANALLAAWDAAPDDGEYPAFWLTEPLHRFQLATAQAGAIAQRLDCIGQALHTRGDPAQARAYFTWSQRWYARSGDQDSAARSAAAIAHCLEDDGDRMASRLLAIDLYDKAIQLWRAMSRACRAMLGGDPRIDTLRSKLAEAGKRAVAEEMQAIRIPQPDVADLIALTCEGMTGLDTLDALRAFADQYNGPDVAALRQSVETSLHSSVFGQLFGSMTMSDDGRPIEKVDAPIEGDDRGEMTQRMVRDFYLEVEQLLVPGQLIPALEILRNEHALRREDWTALARESAFIPPDRVSLVAKGLHAGFQGDFVEALHLLVPQLENAVRYHLKRAGAHTTTYTKRGTVMELGLSSLVELPEMLQVFKEDLTFEIDAVFCEQHGPNFRNVLAHGLVHEHQLHSRLGIYAWWMIFRLVFNCFWNSRRPSPEAEPDDGPPAPVVSPDIGPAATDSNFHDVAGEDCSWPKTPGSTA